MGVENNLGKIQKASKDALKHQLELLAGINLEIEMVRRQNHSSAVLRQYEKLKREYTKELLNILAVYDLPITMTKAKPVQAEPKVTAA